MIWQRFPIKFHLPVRNKFHKRKEGTISEVSFTTTTTTAAAAAKIIIV